MVIMFTARRLKPGAWEQFRSAWDPGDSRPPGLRRAYHARNIRDEDEVISFGLFDMTLADGVWTLDRKAAGPKDFDQRMKATFSTDGTLITAEFELRDSQTHQMRHDFSVTYRRIR